MCGAPSVLDMTQPRRSVVPEVLTAVAATAGAVGLIAGVCFVLYRFGPDLDRDQLTHFWTWDPGLWVTLIFKLKIFKVIAVLIGVVGFMAVRIISKLGERRERRAVVDAPPVYGPPVDPPAPPAHGPRVEGAAVVPPEMPFIAPGSEPQRER
jgi:hypothetical protein